MILFFDTETSGLPLWREPSDDPRQPRIVSLSAMLCNDDQRIIERLDTIIKPEGWVIGEDTIKIHGITNERALEEGRQIEWVMAEFMSMYGRAELLVGHNVSFDIRMLRIEMKRMGIDRLDKATFCTAAKSAAICNMDATHNMVAAGFNKPKTPKLSEAYQILFGEPLEGAHTSRKDVEACARIYYHLKARGI